MRFNAWTVLLPPLNLDSLDRCFPSGPSGPSGTTCSIVATGALTSRLPTSLEAWSSRYLTSPSSLTTLDAWSPRPPASLTTLTLDGLPRKVPDVTPKCP